MEVIGGEEATTSPLLHPGDIIRGARSTFRKYRLVSWALPSSIPLSYDVNVENLSGILTLIFIIQ